MRKPTVRDQVAVAAGFLAGVALVFAGAIGVVMFFGWLLDNWTATP